MTHTHESVFYVSRTHTQSRTFLQSLFSRAIAIAAPENTVPLYCPKPPDQGQTIVIAAGKAAASMAKAFETAWPKDAALSGVALTRYGHGVDCEKITVIEAAHPVPDDRGHDAAKEILKTCEALTAKDLLVCLISGGGSSLLALPADGISLADKKEMNRQLLACGAPIGEMNVLRKHVSAIKGGRLAAAAHPAQIVTLAISDVPGDDLATIASGPTVPDKSTRQDALAIVEKYDLKLAKSIIDHLKSDRSETPKPGHPIFDHAQTHLIATPTQMIDAVAADLSGEAFTVHNLGAEIEGEAHEVAQEHARLVRKIREDQPDRPHLIVSGGETTVTVQKSAATNPKKPARGGRNCEYLLALTIALDGMPGVTALAADTDGIDGSEDNAGAITDETTLKRAEALGMNAQDALAAHDSYTFFKALGDLIVTGPTRTNVNDFRAIWIEPSD